MEPTEQEASLQALLDEVRLMRQSLDLLIERTPVNSWIPPRELARLAGISAKTIAAYRKQGIFGPEHFRPVQRGQRIDWQYYRDGALSDLGKVA